MTARFSVPSVSSLDVPEDLRELLWLTDPNGGMPWRLWHAEIRPGLADYLERIGCDWACTVRDVVLETRTATRSPKNVQYHNADWRDVDHPHDTVTVGGGRHVTALMLAVNDKLPPARGCFVHVASGVYVNDTYDLIGDVPLILGEWAVPMPITLTLCEEGPVVDFAISYVHTNVLGDLECGLNGKLSAMGRLERMKLLGLVLRNLAPEFPQ